MKQAEVSIFHAVSDHVCVENCEGRSRGRVASVFEEELPPVHDQILVQFGIVFHRRSQAFMAEQTLDTWQVIHRLLEPYPADQVPVEVRIDPHADVLVKEPGHPLEYASVGSIGPELAPLLTWKQERIALVTILQQARSNHVDVVAQN